MILTHQVIDLRGNDIGILKNDVFRESGLTNLQRIFCPHCRIAEIEPRAFRYVGGEKCAKRTQSLRTCYLSLLSGLSREDIELLEHNGFKNGPGSLLLNEICRL